MSIPPAVQYELLVKYGVNIQSATIGQTVCIGERALPVPEDDTEASRVPGPRQDLRDAQSLVAKGEL